jgi:hypothetical protein
MCVVTPERQQALDALRAWSATAAPETRARLIERAWNAGEHNVSALAEAADVTRKTIYADLESRGINARTDRQETPVMQTITIGPYTGLDGDDELEANLRAIRQKYQVPHDADDATVRAAARAFHEEGVRHMQQFEAARYHNTLAPFAQREAEAREAAQRALHRVETAWAALRTARAWHAAHHSYVETVHAARHAVTAWRDAAEEMYAQDGELSGRMFHKDAYAKHVPEDQHIRVDGDTPKLTLVELEETHARRRAVAAETLGLTGDVAGGDQ